MVEKQTKDISHCILGMKMYHDEWDFRNEAIVGDKENILVLKARIYAILIDQTKTNQLCFSTK